MSFYGINAAAEAVGCSTERLRQLERDGAIPHARRAGNRRFYDEQEIAEIAQWYRERRAARLAQRNATPSADATLATAGAE